MISPSGFQVLCRITVIASILFLAPFTAFSSSNDGIIQTETGFYYTVQKGDTLWDLSQKFMDSPWTWPGLWYENSEIPNPHWIYPGQKIRLYLKQNISEMPAEQQPEILLEEQERPYYFFSRINSIGFIKKQPVKPSGTLLNEKNNRIMIGTGDLVYLKAEPEENAFDIGDRFTVYRTLPSVKNKKQIGTRYYITGVAEVVKKEQDYVKARILKSFRSITPGDKLMPYVPKSEKIYLTPPTENISGEIIVAEEKEEAVGDGNVVYINKGEDDGVLKGQSYTIFSDPEQYGKKTKKNQVEFKSFEIGILLILHTEKTTSTALVIKSDTDIHPGFKFATPKPM